MTLTKDDEILLAAAGLTVALAYQQGPHHVSTAKGAQFYHLPVGAVIIPHPYNPDPDQGVHGWIPEDKWKEGEKEWVEKGEAIWKANEWKGEGHRVVYVGHNAYAVPSDAHVWVLKDTDLGNDQDVLAAPKYVTTGEPGSGTSGNIGQDGQIHGGQFTVGAQQALQKDWKELPAGQAKMPVAVNGKIISWVPQDWKVYVHTGGDAGAAKVAQDPQGGYHVINSFGMSSAPPGPGTLNLIKTWIQTGTYKLETAPGQTAQDKAHVPPAEGVPGPAEPKVNAGGVAVTKDELHSGIGILQNDKSTNVKGPFKKSGHPLQHMDYMGVAKDELAKHPELKVSQGTKKQHVGHVKLALIHHLSGLAEKMHADEAQAKAAQHAAEAAKAKAAHAQELTPGTWTLPKAADKLGGVPGIYPTTAEIAAAAKAFEESGLKATAKQIFSKSAAEIGPMTKVDFWKVVGDWKDKHPEDKKLKPKQAFVKALQSLIAGEKPAGEPGEEPAAPSPAAPETVQVGHSAEQASELDQLIANGHYTGPPPGNTGSGQAQIAKALQDAHQLQQPVWVWNSGGGFGASYAEPPGTDYYKVTPEHKVLYHNPDTGTDTWMGEASVQMWAKQYLSGLEEKPAVAPGSIAEAMQQYAEKKHADPPPLDKSSPEYQQLHALADNADLTKTDETTDTQDWASVASLAFLLAHTSGAPWYLKEVPGGNGYWTTTNTEPPTGQPGAPGLPYWKFTPAHSVVQVDQSGVHEEYPSSVILSDLKTHLKLAEPEEGEGTEPVTIHGYPVGEVPAGSLVYYAPNHLMKGAGEETLTTKYAKTPENDWLRIGANGVQQMGHVTATQWDKFVENGEFKLLSTLPAAQVHDEPLKDPFSITHGPGLAITKDKAVVGYAPEGSKVYVAQNTKDTEATAKYVLWPDGSWYFYDPASSALHQQTYGSAKEFAANGNILPIADVKAKLAAAKPVTPPTQPVSVKGKIVGTVPEGSAIYYSTAHVQEGENPADTVTMLYVKAPDGEWMTAADVTGVVSVGAGKTMAGSDYNKILADGTFQPLPPSGTKQADNIEVYIAAFGAGPAGFVPAGSKFYRPKGMLSGMMFVRAPNGEWYTISQHTGIEGPQKPDFYATDSLKEIEPPSTGPVHLITPGAAKVPQAPAEEYPSSPPGFEKVLDMAKALATGGHEVSAVYIQTNGSGTSWYHSTGHEPGSGADYWKVEKDGTVTHHVPGTSAAKPDIKVTAGTHTGTVPAGSKFYTYPTATATAPGVVYAKAPDGHWYRIGTALGVSEPKAAGFYDDQVSNGHIVEVTKPLGGKITWEGQPEKPELPPVEQPAPEPGAPEVQVIHKGKLVDEKLPPGTKIYTDPESTYYTWARDHEGTWYRVDAYGAYKQAKDTNTAQSLEAKLQEGKLKEQAPATPELIAQMNAATDLGKYLKSGAMAKVIEHTGWQPVIVSELAATHAKGHGYPTNFAYAKHDPGNGTWQHVQFNQPGKDEEFVAIGETSFEGYHHVPGQEDTPVPFADVKQAVDEHLTPDAVLVHGKVIKYGFYYKPKGKAGTYLEVKDGSKGYNNYSGYKYGSAGKAIYIWHGVSEDKVITPTVAEKHLATEGIEHYPEAKPYVPALAQTLKTAKYATVHKHGQAGTYTLYQDEDGPGASLEIHADGSGLLYTPGLTDQPVGQPVVTALLESGTLLDQHGNTVVQPGIQPKGIHLFGKAALTPQDAAEFAQALEDVYDASPGTSAKPALDQIKHWLPGFTDDYEAKQKAHAYWGSGTLVGTLTWSKQSSGISKYLREVALVADNKLATAKAPEVSFLKGLPPGIHTSKDVFDLTDKGWAKPFDGVLGEQVGDQVYTASMTKPELAAKIKEVSAQYGGGKVVGTHPSSMTKDQQVLWLDSWDKGGMETVFNLDASGGKVSPAHPGAPENTATHQVTWAPWGDGQIPAGKVPDNPAGWTDTSVDMPKAEVANYLIKAGLDHAEFLSAADRRRWVKQHRQGNQQIVNLLSKTAFERHEAHDNPLSDPLKWTDDLKPAKSYDVHLEDKKPAQSWPAQSQEDFLADYANDPVLVKAIAEVKADSSYPYNYQFIQRYLDAKEAAELAEKLKPRYHVTGEAPAGGFGKVISDQFGHKFLFDPGMAGEQKNTILAAHALARTWGFKTPRALVLTTEDGETGLARALPDGTPLAEVPGFWTGTPDFGTLTQRQVSDIAREQVLDWALGNPLSGPQNLLRTDDGAVVGTDKAGAFQAAWDGLGPGADSQVKQASSALFDAVRSHGIPKAVADQAYTDAVRAAYRMSQLNDVRMAELVGEHMALPGFLVTRKDALREDITKLWQGVYKDAGWKLPEVKPEKLTHGLHSGFSEPSFFDHVMVAKNAGAPAFFGGSELEDGHFLVWTEMAGENRLINGESALLGPALEKIQQWAEGHQTEAEMDKQPDAPDVGGNKAGIKDEHSFHLRIVAAAKSVSRHAQDQLWAGPVTTAALQGMADAKQELQERLELAEMAQQHPESSAGFVENYGNVAYNINMVKYYLGLVQKVEEAKATAGVFKPGELPRWWLPKFMYPAGFEPKVKSQVKVELRSAYRTLNTQQSLGTETNAGYGQDPVPSGHILDPETGELHLGTMTYEYPGKAWYITLPTGEVIEINDTGKTGTHAAHQGRIRFRANAAEGAASMERIRSQLQDMGLSLDEAQLPDMELLYWRVLAHTLADRVDRTEGPHKAVWDTIKQYGQGVLSTPESLHKRVNDVVGAGLPQDEEIALWRKAWSALTTSQQVQQWADAQGFMPHLDHFDVKNPEVTGGKPYWYRFDATPEAVGKLKLAGHDLGYKAKTDVSGHVVRTGQLSSTEARLRSLGIWRPGKSSTTDMAKGSSGTVFLRLNHESGKDVLIHPKVLARVHTYGFNSDQYGAITSRSTMAYFNLQKAAAHTGTSNETDIKDAISLLDNLEFVKIGSENLRQQLIAELKAAGVTTIRGVPVEQRLVTDITDGMIAQAHQRIKAEGESMLTHPESVYVAPPSEQVTHAAITTEAEEAAYEASVSDAGEHETTVSHEQASPQEAVSQVFYQSPSKDPQAGSPSVAGKVKGGMAKRVAGQMASTDEAIAAFHTAAGLHAPESWGGNPRDRTIGALVATWAQGNSSPVALAVQNRASQLFGLAKDPLPPLGYANAETEAAAQALEEGYGQVIDDFLTAMWTLTQNDLHAADIGNVTLYRILRFSGDIPQWVQDAEAGQVIDSPAARPMSSWAFTQAAAESAATFTMGGAKGVVVKATMPRELLLSYPRSGLGCYNEFEFVVLDAKGQWEIVKVTG